MDNGFISTYVKTYHAWHGVLYHTDTLFWQIVLSSNTISIFTKLCMLLSRWLCTYSQLFSAWHHKHDTVNLTTLISYFEIFSWTLTRYSLNLSIIISWTNKTQQLSNKIVHSLFSPRGKGLWLGILDIF